MPGNTNVTKLQVIHPCVARTWLLTLSFVVNSGSRAKPFSFKLLQNLFLSILSVSFSVSGEQYSQSTNMFDLNLHMTSVWVSSVWWQTSGLHEVLQKGVVCVEGPGDTQAILCLFLNLGGVDSSQRALLYTSWAGRSCLLCDFSTNENCCRFLIDWHFGCRTGGVCSLHCST